MLRHDLANRGAQSCPKQRRLQSVAQPHPERRLILCRCWPHRNQSHLSVHVGRGGQTEEILPAEALTRRSTPFERPDPSGGNHRRRASGAHEQARGPRADELTSTRILYLRPGILSTVLTEPPDRPGRQSTTAGLDTGRVRWCGGGRKRRRGAGEEGAIRSPGPVVAELGPRLRMLPHLV